MKPQAPFPYSPTLLLHELQSGVPPSRPLEVCQECCPSPTTYSHTPSLTFSAQLSCHTSEALPHPESELGTLCFLALAHLGVSGHIPSPSRCRRRAGLYLSCMWASAPVKEERVSQPELSPEAGEVTRSHLLYLPTPLCLCPAVRLSPLCIL